MESVTFFLPAFFLISYSSKRISKGIRYLFESGLDPILTASLFSYILLSIYPRKYLLVRLKIKHHIKLLAKKQPKKERRTEKTIQTKSPMLTISIFAPSRHFSPSGPRHGHDSELRTKIAAEIASSLFKKYQFNFSFWSLEEVYEVCWFNILWSMFILKKLR